MATFSERLYNQEIFLGVLSFLVLIIASINTAHLDKGVKTTTKENGRLLNGLTILVSLVSLIFFGIVLFIENANEEKTYGKNKSFRKYGMIILTSLIIVMTLGSNFIAITGLNEMVEENIDTDTTKNYITMNYVVAFVITVFIAWLIIRIIYSASFIQIGQDKSLDEIIKDAQKVVERDSEIIDSLRVNEERESLKNTDKRALEVSIENDRKIISDSIRRIELSTNTSQAINQESMYLEKMGRNRRSQIISTFAKKLSKISNGDLPVLKSNYGIKTPGSPDLIYNEDDENDIEVPSFTSMANDNDIPMTDLEDLSGGSDFPTSPYPEASATAPVYGLSNNGKRPVDGEGAGADGGTGASEGVVVSEGTGADEVAVDGEGVVVSEGTGADEVAVDGGGTGAGEVAVDGGGTGASEGVVVSEGTGAGEVAVDGGGTGAGEVAGAGGGSSGTDPSGSADGKRPKKKRNKGKTKAE